MSRRALFCDMLPNFCKIVIFKTAATTPKALGRNIGAMRDSHLRLGGCGAFCRRISLGGHFLAPFYRVHQRACLHPTGLGLILKSCGLNHRNVVLWCNTPLMGSLRSLIKAIRFSWASSGSPFLYRMRLEIC